MEENGFNPADITINVGDTVRWVNEGLILHTSTSGAPPGTPDGLWNSGNLNPGQSYERQFNGVGTFPYYCIPHYLIGMVGTVTVTEKGPPSASNASLWAGAVSFNAKVTFLAADSGGNQKFNSSTERFNGTMELIRKDENVLIADGNGCLIIFTGDDNLTVCIKKLAPVETLTTSRTDKLLMIGTGFLPSESVSLSTGVLYILTQKDR